MNKKDKRIEELRILLERRARFFTKDKSLKVRIFQREILVLKNGEDILRKGPYIIDLGSVGWTGKYSDRYTELVRLVYARSNFGEEII